MRPVTAVTPAAAARGRQRHLVDGAVRGQRDARWPAAGAGYVGHSVMTARAKDLGAARTREAKGASWCLISWREGRF